MIHKGAYNGFSIARLSHLPIHSVSDALTDTSASLEPFLPAQKSCFGNAIVQIHFKLDGSSNVLANE
eukprot:3341827-Amphidinium_carterae.1